MSKAFESLQERMVKLIPLVAAVMAVTFLAFSSAPVIWRLAGHDPDKVEFDPRAPSLPGAIVKPISLSDIDRWSPFGLYLVEKKDTPIQETSLGLVLRGVFVSSDEKKSIATIEDKENTAAYLMGDRIAGRAVLLKVLSNLVLIDVDGTTEILSFPVDNGKQIPASGNGLSRLKAAFSTGQNNVSDNSTQPETTEDYISYWRQRIARNPGEVLKEIGLVATDKGYRIAESHDVGVRKAGLKAGDLITTVNGKKVGNVENDRRLYDEIDAAGQARIEVVRNGKKIILTFPLR